MPMHSVKIVHNGRVLMKLCLPVLGIHFFETQCTYWGTGWRKPTNERVLA